RLYSFFGQANKKDDKINELYAQFMILEEAEEIRAVIGYEQSEENALILSSFLLACPKKEYNLSTSAFVAKY
ncbi:hypothetical protein ACT453_61480, partial [Bacillus sp. D-CC]